MSESDTAMLLDVARDFVDRRVRPQAQELDETERFPSEIYDEMAEIGMFGITVPEEHGGLSASHEDFFALMEVLASGYAAVADQAGLIEMVGGLISQLGTDQQRKDYLEPLLRGELRCAYCLTEPDAGSDLGSLRSIARPDGDGWRLTGEKTWINNARIADFGLVLAITDPDARKRDKMSLFLVDLDREGVERGPSEHKMGQRGSVLGNLIFNDVRVEPEELLGEPGRGFPAIMGALDGGRIAIAGLSLGVAGRALEVAQSYAAARTSFGRAIEEYQAIAFRLADAVTEIRAAQLLARDAARRTAEPGGSARCSMAKLFASETALRVTDLAVQVYGGAGYVRGFEPERLYRDIRVVTIYEGTSEMQRLVISRALAQGQPLTR